MKTSIAPLAALLLSLSAGAASAQVPGLNHDPSQVPAGVYAVEPKHTRIMFSVNHLGFTDYFGQFNDASGQLRLDPAASAASAVSVSIPTASLATSNDVLDAELKGAKWLDVAQFPAMTFKATGVVRTGADSAVVTGDLTLHGVTRPVSLKARFNASGVNPLSKRYTVGFNATTDIRRSDFGITAYTPLIGDDVTIIISAAFEKTQ